MKSNEIVKAKNVCKESEHLFYQNKKHSAFGCLNPCCLMPKIWLSALAAYKQVGLNCNYEPRFVLY